MATLAATDSAAEPHGGKACAANPEIAMSCAAPSQAKAAIVACGAPGHAVAQAAAEKDTSVQEVVVTGSRVIQNGNNSPTPVTVVSTQQLLQSTPSTVAPRRASRR